MAISVNHSTYVITIPKADTTLVGTNAATGYEIRSYSEYALMRELADYLDSEAGMGLPNAFTHATQVTISGIVYARSLLFLAPYTVTFEAGAYQVKLNGGTNNNMLDVLNPNNVSVIPANSAGLQTVATGGGGGATAADVWAYPTRTLTTASNSTFMTPLAFKVSTNTTAADPGAGRIRWNNATQSAATELYIDTVTDDNLDIDNYIDLIPVGALVYIQDRDDATAVQKWLITSLVHNVGWTQIGVSSLSFTGGNLPNNHSIAVMFNNQIAGALSTEQATQLAELYRIHGLQLGFPLTVTATSRVADGVTQTLSDDGTTVTVTRT